MVLYMSCLIDIQSRINYLMLGSFLKKLGLSIGGWGRQWTCPGHM